MSQTRTTHIGKISNRPNAKKVFGKVASYVALSVVTLIFFAPIAYLLIGSLKPNDEVLAGLRGFIPEHLSFNNYLAVFNAFDSDATGYFWQFYLTSAIVTTLIVVGGLVVNSMLAYALARLRWRDRKSVV